MGAGARVLRLQRGRERGHGLVVRALQEMPLPALDLEQVAQVARVEEQLLLRLALARGAERDPVEAAGEALDDREQLERAERLPEKCLGADLESRVGRAAVRTAENDDRN